MTVPLETTLKLAGGIALVGKLPIRDPSPLKTLMVGVSG